MAIEDIQKTIPMCLLVSTSVTICDRKVPVAKGPGPLWLPNHLSQAGGLYRVMQRSRPCSVFDGKAWMPDGLFGIRKPRYFPSRQSRAQFIGAGSGAGRLRSWDNHPEGSRNSILSHGAETPERWETSRRYKGSLPRRSNVPTLDTGTGPGLASARSSFIRK